MTGDRLRIDWPEFRRIWSWERLEKWFMMITYGLDENVVEKAIAKKDFKRVKAFDSNDVVPIEFSTYALVGLKNFYASNPELFLSRLAKGPPP